MVLEIMQAECDATQDPPMKIARRDIKQRLRAAFEDDKCFRSLFNKSALQAPAWTLQMVLDVAALAGPPDLYHESFEPTMRLAYESIEPLKRALLHQLAAKLMLYSARGSPRMEGRVQIRRVDFQFWFGYVKPGGGMDRDMGRY